MNHVYLKIGITISALALMSARLIWPDLNIDLVTVCLLILAFIPWVTSIIESVKFPGGWEITLRDVQEAVKGFKVRESADYSAEKYLLFSISDHDPNLALVALRIEIEKRIREFAEMNGLESKQSLSLLVHELEEKEPELMPTLRGLYSLVEAGNKAAHGARVEPSVYDFARHDGARIIAELDRAIDFKKDT